MITNHYNFPETEFPKVGYFDLKRTYFVLGLRDAMRFVTVGYGDKHLQSIETRRFLRDIQKNLNIDKAIQEAKDLNIYDEIMDAGKKQIQLLGTVEEQIIDPKYWGDISNLFGMGTNLILHPHLWLAFLEQVKSFEPSSDCLVVCQCGAAKPYSNARNKRWIIEASLKSKKFDLCVWSVVPIMITPIDFSVSYPFYFYEAGHYSSEATSDFEQETSVTYGLMLLILLKKYKKIVFIDNTTWRDGNRLRYIGPWLDKCGIEYHHVISEKDLEECTKKVAGNKGLAKSRILSSRIAKDNFFKILGINEEELKNIPNDDPWYIKEKARIDRNKKFGILYDENKKFFN